MARGIVRWVREVMADPEGGYAASQDADVGLRRRRRLLHLDPGRGGRGADAPTSWRSPRAYYDIGTAGEMHHDPGKNVLFVAASRAPIVAAPAAAPDDGGRRAPRLGAAQKLLAARARRPAPFVDRTRYTNWNAMMASALLRAGAVLGDDWARAHALATLRRLRARERRAGCAWPTPRAA